MKGWPNNQANIQQTQKKKRPHPCEYPQVLTVRSVRRAALIGGRNVRPLVLLPLRGVRDWFRGPDALAATRAMDQAHTQDGQRAPGTTGALQLGAPPAISTPRAA